ncbi:MAG: gluconate 2-dehydrogenase gamma chain [Oceanospirillaceae bacterium]|jgi:gluconate 2-dehydrogenase gamma chain
MNDENIQIGRRNAFKLIATTAVAVPVIGYAPFVRASQSLDTPIKAHKRGSASGSLSDPDLLNPTVHWELLLTQTELVTLAALCDVIIPEDKTSPSASAVGAQHYINEWASAPYYKNKKGLTLIRGGISWLNSESKKRFIHNFEQLNIIQKQQICDDINWLESATDEFRNGAHFFAEVRNLTATAFYTTPEGMADIGYIGNKALASFDGPSAEILKILKLT